MTRHISLALLIGNCINAFLKIRVTQAWVFWDYKKSDQSGI